MIRLKQQNDGYMVYLGEQSIGTVHLYDNPLHIRNCYVKLELEQLDVGISADLFHKLREIVKRPLQVMADSDNAALVKFLVAGGFACRRKCYEMKVSAEDYIGGKADTQLVHGHAGDPDYEQCCQTMFDYYTETHKAVNPWTAGYDTFCQHMPAEVVFARVNGKITSLAFVEENEIAYVWGTDKQHFKDFAGSLVAAMFEKYQTVCFESDDCDWAAMILKSLFLHQGETSFDTYTAMLT